MFPVPVVEPEERYAPSPKKLLTQESRAQRRCTSYKCTSHDSEAVDRRAPHHCASLAG
jgi:hypothetical protein